MGRLISRNHFNVKNKPVVLPRRISIESSPLIDMFTDRILNISKPGIKHIPRIRVLSGNKSIGAIIEVRKEYSSLGIITSAIGQAYSDLVVMPLASKRLLRLNLGRVSQDAGDINLHELRISRETIERIKNQFNFEDPSITITDAFLVDTTNIDMRGDAILEKISTGEIVLLCNDNLTCSDKLYVKPGGKYSVNIGKKRIVILELGVSTINTEHPIYRPGEKVVGYITVLDKNGYTAFSANVTLTITTPSNETIVKTYPGEIEKIQRGVYRFNYTPSMTGKYYLHVDAVGPNVYNSMDSWFYVNDSFPFDITRIEPFSIDPWRGPFTSIIHVKPLIDIDRYVLIEKLPKSFEVVSTNGHVYKYNDSVIITWPLRGESNVSYTAQAPLESPAVYKLGEARILYQLDPNSEEEIVFQEARPWLLALDPAAKICNESPCIVPSSLIQCRDNTAGGTEPNQPNTIDACTDGTSGTCHSDESVENITIESLNHSVFRAGDTVRVNITVYCWDGSSDNVNIAYTCLLYTSPSPRD